MGFARELRRLRDDRVPLGRRYLALLALVERYAFLAQVTFDSVLARLRRHGFSPGVPHAAAVLLRAGEEIAGARASFLVRLRAFESQRRRLKREGRRAPRPAETHALWDGAFGDLLPRRRPPPAPVLVVPDHLPPPAFAIGSRVSVVLSARNHTPRRGVVVRCVWHGKLDQWTFFLAVADRRVSKRYLAEDLRADDDCLAG